MLRSILFSTVMVAALAAGLRGVDDSSSAVTLSSPIVRGPLAGHDDSSSATSSAGHAVRVVLNAQDKFWLKTAIQGDLFEIAKSRLALQLSASKKVKALASELIKDHTKALHAKVKLAKALRVAVPTHPNPLQQAQLKMLRKLRGSKFDKAWLQVQLAAHKLAIAAAKKEVLAGANKAVKAEAARELPVLQHHLKQVVALLALYTKPAVVLAQPVRAHDSSATSSGY